MKAVADVEPLRADVRDLLEQFDEIRVVVPGRRGDACATPASAAAVGERLLRSRTRLREDRMRSPEQERLGPSLVEAE